MAVALSKTPIKHHLSPLLNVLCWAEISRQYFGKSNSWIYHKLNGIDGNGKPTTFNDDEKQTLRSSLISLSEKIKEIAESL